MLNLLLNEIILKMNKQKTIIARIIFFLFFKWIFTKLSTFLIFVFGVIPNSFDGRKRNINRTFIFSIVLFHGQYDQMLDLFSYIRIDDKDKQVFGT